MILLYKIKNNILGDNQVIKIDFMSCNNAEVNAYHTDYAYITNTDIGSRGSLIGLLNSFSVRTLIVTASDDDITPNTYEKSRQLIIDTLMLYKLTMQIIFSEIYILMICLILS